tara:strand:- start:470 stop:703 length:234 start_codon:yes stop_codon:yes gene_type:complete
MKMTHKLLTNDVELALNMVRQSEQKLDHHAKCVLMGKIGYLQGSYRVKAGQTSSNTEKSSYNAILAQLDGIQKEVMA